MITTGRHLTAREVAQGYDRIAHAVQMPAYFHPEVVRFLGDVSGLRILDVGCGPGSLLRLLAERDCASLSGLEMSTRLCSLAKETLKGQARICCGNIQEGIPYPDGSFDRVLLTEVIEHLARPVPALREAVRVLAMDGRILLTVPNSTAYEPLFSLAERRGGKGRWEAGLPWEHPRKTQQPIDTVYTFREICTLLEGSGLVVRRMHGREAFPYLWDWMYIERRPRLRAILQRIESMRPLADRLANRVRAHRFCYRLFIECVLPPTAGRSNVSPSQVGDR
jgi:ubiquinone/menaquinone biosynthesis C-methylase UbiE